VKVGLLMAALAALLAAQAPAPQTFEVATVKVSLSGGGIEGSCHGIDSTYPPGGDHAPPPLGRCVFTDARLGHLVNIAFGVRNMGWIRSSPDWATMGDVRFNIEAKCEDPARTTEAQLLEMLQALLIERFQMKFHRETVETTGQALVVGKNGPKLKPSTGEQRSLKFETLVDNRPVAVFKPLLGKPIILHAQRQSMRTLATMLTQIGQVGPVADRTGLDGAFDYRLAWDAEAGPSLGSALQDQLGLKLEQHKVPVTYFVIDSAKKPSAN
jgi:uncharacterized protein (TIGR03435 family)